MPLFCLRGDRCQCAGSKGKNGDGLVSGHTGSYFTQSSYINLWLVYTLYLSSNLISALHNMELSEINMEHKNPEDVVLKCWVPTTPSNSSWRVGVMFVQPLMQSGPSILNNFHCILKTLRAIIIRLVPKDKFSSFHRCRGPDAVEQVLFLLQK